MTAFFLRQDVLAVLLGFNAIGTIWGFIWYREQLVQTPWYFWPLTPDCPLTSFCFFLFLLWLRKGTRWRPDWKAAVSWIAVLGSLKYGAWTVIVLGQYILYPGSQPDWQDWMLVGSHLGLLAEGWIFRRQLPAMPTMYGAAMVWFLANDYADWLLMIHPRLPLPAEIGFAMWTSMGLTLIVYFWGKRLLKQNIELKWDMGVKSDAKRGF